MKYTLSEISEILKIPVCLNKGDEKLLYVSADSRTINQPDKTLFTAVISATGNGNNFMRECINKGVKSFLISDESKIPAELKNEINYIVVKDGIIALQQLAAYHRSRFEIPIIGITGSNGKTVVKEWLWQLMNEKFFICRSPKSYNSQLGVPLSVLNLNQDHTLGIFEAGVSKPGEMEKLEPIISPQIGIFTNLGNAHQENFESLKQKAREKIKLLKASEKIFYCIDYPDVSEVINEALANGYFTSRPELTGWSMKENIRLNLQNNSTEISISLQNKSLGFAIPFTDKASIENSIHCALVMQSFNYSEDEIKLLMANLQPVEMRLEIKSGINNCTLINDTYNSDLQSLKIALDVLDQQHQHSKKVIILSDIYQSGNNKIYKEVSESLQLKNDDLFVGIGKEISAHKNLFGSGSAFYESTESFLSEFDFGGLANAAVLVKGSRVFSFEKIINRLQQKLHDTVLEIDLNAIVSNFNFYKSLLNPSTKIMGMVKAFSYGSGAYEIASVLQHHHVDYLAVAYADEGLMLRNKGIHLPIMVMSPTTGSISVMAENNLEPEVFSLSFLNEVIAYRNSKKGISLRLHIKIDTGMHRLGFLPDEVSDLIDTIKQNPDLKIASVFSHLSSADMEKDDAFTQKQFNVFDDACEKIKQGTGQDFIKHILNSSGITRFADAQYDMVRLGIGLYGIDPTGKCQKSLENANTLKTYITQIKHLRQGETVGYNRRGVIEKNTKIAVIGIGYADGFLRTLGNGNFEVSVLGKKAKTIGSVCMDMSMIDVTDIDCAEGDEVIIFGENKPVQEMADALNTIPYEVYTGISSRVKRVYFKS